MGASSAVQSYRCGREAGVRAPGPGRGPSPSTAAPERVC